jgi:hypothetical protein
MGFIGDLFGGGGDDAANASINAANVQADYQREALEYLKEREQLPQEFRESALKQIASAYGVEGGTGSQQQLIDQARASPLYGAIMGGQMAGEDAILRQQSATGGLRSGNTQHALYDYNTNLENQALLESYNQQMTGLGGLASLPSLTTQIAQGTSGIGQTLAQGQVAAGQAQASGQNAGFGNMLGLGQLGLNAYGAFSDRRLKSKIKKIGTWCGLNWYEWQWNDLAHSLGLSGTGIGVMADEAEQRYPGAVGERQGYKTVNYGVIADV